MLVTLQLQAESSGLRPLFKWLEIGSWNIFNSSLEIEVSACVGEWNNKTRGSLISNMTFLNCSTIHFHTSCPKGLGIRFGEPRLL